jgi:hypothetical protein
MWLMDFISFKTIFCCLLLRNNSLLNDGSERSGNILPAALFIYIHCLIISKKFPDRSESLFFQTGSLRVLCDAKLFEQQYYENSLPSFRLTPFL